MSSPAKNRQEDSFADAIGAELERVRSSPQFANSARMGRFLTLLVERALAGAEPPKEYVIAQEVFQRGPEFDPRMDSVVRVGARRLRRKLAQYYQAGGRGAPVRIALKPGSYSVEFQRDAAPAPAGRALAVLPFANLSADLDAGRFCDGLADELASSLGRQLGLGIAPRRDTLRFRGSGHNVTQVGSELAVDFVVEGSVRSAGGRCRVTVELARAEDARSFWCETYEHQGSDWLTLQEELSRAIVADLARVLGRPTAGLLESVSSRARVLYQKGCYHWHRPTRQNLEQAVRYFERAIAEEREFALAYCGLADSHTALAFHAGETVSGRAAAAREAALRAIVLDRSLAQAHASLAWVDAVHDWNWPAAEQCFQQALTLDPNCSTARLGYALTCLAPAGRLQEAIVEAERARQLDPTSLAITTSLSLLLFFDGQYREAAAQLQEGLELDPNFCPAQVWLGLAYERLDQPAEAARVMERAFDSAGGDPLASLGLAYVYAVAGQADRARALTDSAAAAAPGATTWFWSAAVKAALGDSSDALADLERAWRGRSAWLMFLESMPFFREIRSDPRFRRIAEALRGRDAARASQAE